LGKQRIEKKHTSQFLKDIYSTLDEIIIYLEDKEAIYQSIKKAIAISNSFYDGLKKNTYNIKDQVELFRNKMDFSHDFYRDLRSFIFSDLSLLLDKFYSLFNRLKNTARIDVFKRGQWEEFDPITLLAASYFLLRLNYRQLKNNVNKYFNIGFQPNIELKVVDGKNALWNTAGMKYKEFFSDIRRIKEYAIEIINDCHVENLEESILMLQISEFIKNGIRHGHLFDKDKKVKVWYIINTDYARLIFEDEGEGFKDLEKWNEFNKKRVYYIEKRDVKMAFNYISYRTEKSTENDGGNFLISAMEYWDSGVIFNPGKNKVYVMKYFY